MGILCVFCIYDTIGNDVNIVSENVYYHTDLPKALKRDSIYNIDVLF